ncbi:HtpX-like protease [Actinoplanes sp. SE50]|uniref:M48 family metallopeptidase n=1 Tax=unclassified Actinoplanes TaxID=2626549 RepID=UPI00023EE09C|nr:MULTISPECIES: M48 family metallopeptidase [unclassified Actinoplanes]AEV89023.1 HtpX-like probable protease [Actinoplanes sp. SE50/110]ATO87429.1 HtpX-like protease [Actinoplanes sp. SE50]SLM04847.1 HtpX-like protease [Actinoplanes sp. SE50/110]
MPTALRAAVSVVMLAGFYLLGLAQLVLVGWLIFEIWQHLHGAGAVKLSYLLLAAVGAVLAGLWRAIRAKPGHPHGLIVTPDQTPELWHQVRQLAAEAGTRAPDEIRLVPEVNAAVDEETRLLGLIGGTRRLYIGMPLVQTFTVDQLRSVLAHELGHYSGSHTRLSAVTYRGRLAMHETLSNVGSFNVFGWVFKAYAWLYQLVSSAVARRQELEADLASVRVAGVDAAVSAMRELPVVDAAWDFYFGRYIGYGWELGYAPDDVFGGFAQLYQARADELAEMREAEPDDETSRWDSHPALSERIAAMRAAPRTSHVTDGRPAAVLVPAVELAGMALQREVVDFGTRTVLPWADFTAASMAMRSQNRADRVFRSTARHAGVPEAGLPEVFGLVEAGRLADLATEFFPQATRREAVAEFADVMETLLGLAAVRSGTARWQHSWSGPARLVDQTGQVLDLGEIAKLAVVPETLAEARARLAERGVHVEAARVVEAKATGQGADVLGAVPNVKLDGGEHADLIVLDRGLIFVPAPKSTDDGDKRVGVLVAQNSAADLAARYRYVAYEEVSTVRIEKETPIGATLLLHDGRTVTFQERWSSDRMGRSVDVLRKILGELQERADR